MPRSNYDNISFDEAAFNRAHDVRELFMPEYEQRWQDLSNLRASRDIELGQMDPHARRLMEHDPTYRMKEMVAAYGPEKAMEFLRQETPVAPPATAGTAIQAFLEGGGLEGMAPEQLGELPPGVLQKALFPTPEKPQETDYENLDEKMMRMRAQDRPTGNPIYDEIKPADAMNWVRARQGFETGELDVPKKAAEEPDEWPWLPDPIMNLLFGRPGGTTGEGEAVEPRRTSGGAKVRRID